MSPWNTLVGFIVGVPILYVVYRAFRGLEGALPNVWRALPGAASSGFTIVFAVERPLEELAGGDAREFPAVEVVVPGQRAGLTLGPGKYWIYALPSAGSVNAGDAAGAISAALAGDRSAILKFEDLPVLVG